MSYDSWLQCNSTYRRHLKTVDPEIDNEETENEGNEETTNDELEEQILHSEIAIQGRGVLATTDNRSGATETEEID